jgi:hypothetical protein
MRKGPRGWELNLGVGKNPTYIMHPDPLSTVAGQVPNNGGSRGERDFKFPTMISQKAKEANKFQYPDFTQPNYIIKKTMPSLSHLSQNHYDFLTRVII